MRSPLLGNLWIILADPLSYVICEKSLDENSEYVYTQERNVVAIILFLEIRAITHAQMHTQNIHMCAHTPKPKPGC